MHWSVLFFFKGLASSLSALCSFFLSLFCHTTLKERKKEEERERKRFAFFIKKQTACVVMAWKGLCWYAIACWHRDLLGGLKTGEEKLIDTWWISDCKEDGYERWSIVKKWIRSKHNTFFSVLPQRYMRFWGSLEWRVGRKQLTRWGFYDDEVLFWESGLPTIAHSYRPQYIKLLM